MNETLADAQLAERDRDAKVMAGGLSWPADLLEAVDLLDVAHTRGCAHPACAKAVATLTRYGLLKEAR